MWRMEIETQNNPENPQFLDDNPGEPNDNLDEPSETVKDNENEKDGAFAPDDFFDFSGFVTLQKFPPVCTRTARGGL
jgi:hypothetical protein